MTTVYCFINGSWDTDVVSVAVCAACGAVIGEHVSSNTDYARYDITRDYHRQTYEQHVREQHDAATVETVWLDKPHESAELRALRDTLA